jgi:superfamily II DNA or RNA helicase
LQDAIKAGRLVEYEYFPHDLHLTASESDSWREATERIGIEIARSKKDKDGRSILSDNVKMMLIQRARISKKASNKVGLAVSVLKTKYIEGQRWLVYCEDSEQLDGVRSQLSANNIQTLEYHSSMLGERRSTLDWFKDVGGVLVSIKCLDEGIDIPEVDCALILASSQNPRQFIQRRGRVLRKTPSKTKAFIHDAIVTPMSLEMDPEQSSLLTSELKRAIEFSKSALNRSAGATLRSLAIKLGLDLDTYFEGYDSEVDDDA